MLKFTLYLCLLSGLSFSQIPNNGFEQWSPVNGYQNPDNWGTLNEVTKSYSVFTCVRLNPGNPGNFFLTVKTLSITGKGLIPGRIVSGKIDTSTYKPVSGFPFVSRPSYLSYNMQYMVSLPSDTAYVSVLLTKWNTGVSKRDTIAFGLSRFNAMAHQWFTNNTYLNYKSGDNPDSALIVISSSSVAALKDSYMYIDNLSFNGTVIGVRKNSSEGEVISVYPNPATNILHISASKEQAIPMELSIYNSVGQLIQTIISETNESLIDLSPFRAGIYHLKIQNRSSVVSFKIIVKK